MEVSGQLHASAIVPPYSWIQKAGPQSRSGRIGLPTSADDFIDRESPGMWNIMDLNKLYNVYIIACVCVQ
jgi:hypothetical protein